MNTTLTGRELMQQLLAEIDETDPDLLPPPDPKEKNEKLITIITDTWLKKVFCLASFLRREGKRMVVDLEAIGEDPKKSGAFVEYKQKHDLLMEMFWYGCRNQISTSPSNIGIRKNWELVGVSSSDENPLHAALKRFLEEQ